MAKSLYVDIDALFDTRLSFLDMFYKDIKERVLKYDYYNIRIIDEFDYLSAELFKTMYAYRDKRLLKNAFVTNVLNQILIYANYLKMNLIVHDSATINLDINTFPYLLNKNDKDILKSSILKLTERPDIVIDFIYENPYEYKLTELSEKYYSLYVYDGLDLLNKLILLNGQNDLAPNLTIFTPILLNYPIIKPGQELESMVKSIEENLKFIVDINFLDIEIFNDIRVVK